jgi:hypothetical protein
MMVAELPPSNSAEAVWLFNVRINAAAVKIPFIINTPFVVCLFLTRLLSLFVFSLNELYLLFK